MRCVMGGREQQYKLHYDATLSTDRIADGTARFITALLYLTDVESGGETLLPLADEGLREHGCVGCEERQGNGAAPSIDWREDGCMYARTDLAQPSVVLWCCASGRLSKVVVPAGGA